MQTSSTSRRSPLKRGLDGRFVAFRCDVCEDEGTMDCASCQGTGIGQHGDPDTSKCWACHGRGSVPCYCQREEGDDEPDYDEERYERIRAGIRRRWEARDA